MEPYGEKLLSKLKNKKQIFIQNKKYLFQGMKEAHDKITILKKSVFCLKIKYKYPLHVATVQKQYKPDMNSNRC